MTHTSSSEFYHELDRLLRVKVHVIWLERDFLYHLVVRIADNSVAPQRGDCNAHLPKDDKPSTHFVGLSKLRGSHPFGSIIVLECTMSSAHDWNIYYLTCGGTRFTCLQFKEISLIWFDQVQRLPFKTTTIQNQVKRK